MTEILQRDAVLSPDGVYRYELRRRWGTGQPVAFVMLNPSTADATVDDPTIRRCVGFARAWGFGALVVRNLFALRATDPRELAGHPDAVGPLNDTYLAADDVHSVVCAWGAHPFAVERGAEVRGMFAGRGVRLHHLGLTKAGHPRHPLYLPKTAEPQMWPVAVAS